jgi:TonB family protein
MKKILFLLLLLSFVLSISAQNEPVKIINPVSVGVVNGKAASLPKPIYPAAAKAIRASGAVSVQVLINEEGNVVSASATGGHPLLRAASEQAARAAKFSPTRLDGQLVKVSGVIVYNFVADGNWLSLGRGLAEKNLDFLKTPSLLPFTFVTERKQLETIITENTPEKLDALVELLQTKLSENKIDGWEFSVGLALGKIKTNIDDQNEVRTQLLEIKSLSDFPAENTSENKLSKLKELAKFYETGEFGKKDKILILEICNSIR